MPIYYNYNNVYFKINGQSILVDSASFGVNLELSEKEEMDKSGGFDRVASGGLTSSLSLTYYLTGADPLKAFLESQTKIPFEVAGMTLGGGYLTSYSFNADPFGPIAIQASIDFYEDFGGSFVPQTLPDQDNYYLQFSDMDFIFQGIDANSKIQRLSYNLSQQIEPIYKLGDLTPSEIRFGKRASSADMDTYNFQEALAYTGKAANVTFSIGGEAYSVDGILSSKNVSFGFGQKISAAMSIESTAYGGVPTITNDAPNGASLDVGQTFTITGTNLGSTTAVYFNNNIRVNKFISISDTEIKVKIPRFAKDGPYKVITAGGEIIRPAISINELDVP